MTGSRSTTGGNVSIALAMLLLLAPATGPAQTTADDSAIDGPARESADLQATWDALDSTMRDALAKIMASGVGYIRDAALAAPNDALPPDISNAFEGYIPKRLLSKVRWRVDDSTVSLQRSVFMLGDTRALTADYVILFANAADASSLLVWAHELHHVVQYDTWGIDGFVTRYLDDYESIEHEANEFVWRWRDATREPGGSNAAD